MIRPSMSFVGDGRETSTNHNGSIVQVCSSKYDHTVISAVERRRKKTVTWSFVSFGMRLHFTGSYVAFLGEIDMNRSH